MLLLFLQLFLRPAKQLPSVVLLFIEKLLQRFVIEIENLLQHINGALERLKLVLQDLKRP
jgi:hypothetical protein